MYSHTCTDPLALAEAPGPPHSHFCYIPFQKIEERKEKESEHQENREKSYSNGEKHRILLKKKMSFPINSCGRQCGQKEPWVRSQETFSQL